jgi:hypothetical protein
VKKAVYDAWGFPFRDVYSTWGPLCLSENCTLTEWRDPQTAVCRRKALLAVLASTEVSVVEMVLVKSKDVRSISQSIELRLKDGDIAADPDRIIHWTVVDECKAPWLRFAPVSGLLYTPPTDASFEMVL